MPSADGARRTTPKGIGYWVVRGPDFGFERHGPQTATVDFRIAAKDMTSFVSELMPSPLHVKDIVRLPKSWGLLAPGNASHLRATRVSAKSFSQSKEITDPYLVDTKAATKTYENELLLTVEYATTIDSLFDKDRTNERPEEILEKKISASVEMLSINVNSKTKSLQGGTLSQIKDLATPLVKVIPLQELNFRWSWALDPDFDAIYSLLGCVNATDEDAFLDNAYPGTVMFLGLQAVLEYHHYNGNFCQENWILDYKMAVRKIVENDQTYGWNHIYDPDAQTFRELRRDAGGTSLPLYRSADFSTELFVVNDNTEEEE